MKVRLLALLFAMTCMGCAGARGWISAPTAQYPISLSHGIRAADGHLIANNERQIVGHFDSSKTLVAILYYAAPLNGSYDLSDDVNAQVRAVNGEAVTDLSFETSLCALDWFLVFHMLPFWPGCTTVHVTGNIIRTTSAPPPQ